MVSLDVHEFLFDIQQQQVHALNHRRKLLELTEHLLEVLEYPQFFSQSKHKEDLFLESLAVIEYVFLVVLISSEDVTELVDTLGLMECLNFLFEGLEDDQHVVLLEVYELIQVFYVNLLEEFAQIANQKLGTFLRPQLLDVALTAYLLTDFHVLEHLQERVIGRLEL